MSDTEGIDPTKSIHVAVIGRKRSGKSELAWALFNSYPFDRVLVDPNGDLKVGPTVEDIEAPIPSRWPSWPTTEPHRAPKRRTLRFVPNYLDPAVYEDIDRVVGLAFGHRRTMLFVDECHVAAPAGQMAKHPHMARALRQQRHAELSMILANPRALTVDPLVIAQADLTYIFKLPNPADRKRVAECIGYDPADLSAAIDALGQYEYLCYDVTTDELTHYPPLPKSLIVGHASA